MEKKKIIETEPLLSVYKELLSEGKAVVLTIAGNSMNPWLVHERDKIRLEKISGEPKKGEMLLFQRRDGQYVMHRLRKIRDRNQYFFIGDAQSVTEGPIKREQLIGRVTAVQRKGHWKEKGSFWWEFFEHIWLNIIPLRGGIRRLYGKMKGWIA